MAFCQKVDIFKASLWFSYKDEPANWHILSKDQVIEVLEKNKKREKVASLEEYAVENVLEEEKVFENVVGQDSLTRFDTPKKKRSNRNNKKKKRTNYKKRPANNA